MIAKITFYSAIQNDKSQTVPKRGRPKKSTFKMFSILYRPSWHVVYLPLDGLKPLYGGGPAKEQHFNVSGKKKRKRKAESWNEAE